MPTIVELANQAGQLTRAMSARADLNLHSPMFLGLVSPPMKYGPTQHR